MLDIASCVASPLLSLYDLPYQAGVPRSPRKGTKTEDDDEERGSPEAGPEHECPRGSPSVFLLFPSIDLLTVYSRPTRPQCCAWWSWLCAPTAARADFQGTQQVGAQVPRSAGSSAASPVNLADYVKRFPRMVLHLLEGGHMLLS